jgi:hypothetical protein
MGAGAALFAASAGVNAVSSIASGWSNYQTAKLQAKQYQMQADQMDLQKDILTEQYRDKRRQLEGEAITKAAASGVKISGSTAESISQSLTQIGIEESRAKYNISMEQVNLNTQAKLTKAQGKQQFIASIINAGSSALGSAAKYQGTWGTPTGGANG